MKYNKTCQLIKLGSLLSLSIIISACNSTAKESNTEKTPEQITNTVLTWWNGDYNNNAQIKAAREDGVPIWQHGQHEGENPQMFGGYLPVNSHYRTVDMPAFGGKVLYLEELTFKKEPYRQRIYTVRHDEKNVRVKLWYFKDKKGYLNAWQDLSKIKDIKPEDMTALPDNCDLYVTEMKDGRLHMEMPKNKCKFSNRIFDYQVILSKNDFWFRDRIVNSDTMAVQMTSANFSYHKLSKVSK